MESDFWKERWRNEQTGFHEGVCNSNLKAHWQELNLAKGARVLVPLCGKSVDILWLSQQGYEVIGIELSEIAVHDFFEENDLSATKSNLGDDCQRWKSTYINILCGDFFLVKREMLGRIDALYDRAALIALPEKMRTDYVQHLLKLCGAVPQLLICLEYEQSVLNGPPFSVPPVEVGEYYQEFYRDAHKPFYRENIIEKESRFVEKGLLALHESVYLLQAHKK